MQWHIYEIIPIDFGWSNLQTVKETAARFGEIHGAALAEESSPEEPSAADFIGTWRDAQAAAAAAGQTGPLRQDPVVFWMPDEHEFKPGFVIKEDNNGITYVVSPVPLAHLEKDRVE